jgi:hypothetical protein
MKNVFCALLLCAACTKPTIEPKTLPRKATEQSDFSQREEQVRQALQRSAAAYKEKNYAEFASAMEEATKLSPYNPDLQYRMARAFALNQKKEDSLSILESLVKKELVYPLNHPDLAGLSLEPRFIELTKQTEKLAEPIHPSTSLATLTEQDLLIEGIAYDSQSKNFYLGSVHKREIYVLTPDGKTSSFLTAPPKDLYGVFGMKVDEKNRLLWVASSATAEVSGVTEAEKGRAGVFCFELDSGALRASYMAPTDGKEHVFGDIALGPSGEIYVSDSVTGELYTIKNNTLVVLVPGGYLRSPQGMAVASDGTGLFVTEYASGLYWVELPSGKVYWVETPPNVSRYGMDGLLWAGDSLLVVQNGSRPARVLRLWVAKDKTITQAESVERGHEEMIEPTLGVISGQGFCYVASSQWVNFEGQTLAKETTDARVWCLPPFLYK